MTRRIPSPALVVAMIALCLGLGGSAIAASELTKSKVKSIAKKQAIKTLKARESGLDVKSAKVATTAANADKLGGKPSSDFAPATPEAVHVIGAPGEPAFAPNWAADTSAQPAGFWKDAWGVVHLQGAVQRSGGVPPDGETIFTLPAGYRPQAAYADFVVASVVGAYNTLSIDGDGTVRIYAGTGPSTYTSLEGVSFRP